MNLGLVAWSINNVLYINLGEIYDSEVTNNPKLLRELDEKLKYLYTFKITVKNKKIKIHNEEDFKHFRKIYKITNNPILGVVGVLGVLAPSSNEKIVFKSPVLYNLSKMEPIFKQRVVNIPITISSTNYKTNYRIFIIFPYSSPILRGQIIDTCISMIKNKVPIFILIGGKYGCNKDSTSSLMKRYLLFSGIPSNHIYKSLYDIFPDSLLESLELLQYVINSYQHTDYDVFIASQSTDMLKIMRFVKHNTPYKFQYLCD